MIDVIEMLIIALIFYKLFMWFKKSRAWALFKGILIFLAVFLIAAIFRLNTILWIASKTLSVGIIGLFIIFQPELRRALEQLGKGSIIRRLFGNNKVKERISDQAIEEIVAAVGSMANDHTGALICIERDLPLSEYERTGIPVDSVISRQLLVNIFEDKTPLHDGAVIVRNDRITSATCYLPMSDSMGLNKKYGTRHRAALGLSEATDALTIVVSEETGAISLTQSGTMTEDISLSTLKNRLLEFSHADADGSLKKITKKGKKNNEVL